MKGSSARTYNTSYFQRLTPENWYTSKPQTQSIKSREQLVELRGYMQVIACTAQTGRPLRGQSAKSSMLSAQRVEGRSYSVECKEQLVELRGYMVQHRVQSAKSNMLSAQRVRGRLQSIKCKEQQRVDRRALSAESSWKSLKS